MPELLSQQLLDDIVFDCRPRTQDGQLASYIPQLSAANAAHLGLCVVPVEGEPLSAGDAAVRFTIQSISKVLIFTCALLDSGVERILKKVSLEPTADAFNSITALETKNLNKPLNPFINAGAIACLTQAGGDKAGEQVGRVLALCKALTGDETICVNEEVYRSEKATGSRNRALAYYMKSTGIIDGDVEELLDAYFQICAIEMDCRALARIALIYASDGRDPHTGKKHFSKQIARIVLATMTMCGMYDESGTVAVTVGLPCKSGVGGGIMAAAPGRMGIAAFGPALNEKGSSTGGLAALTALSKALDLSIF